MRLADDFSKPKVLLVEDDAQISRSLALNLNLSGFTVNTAASLAQARERLAGANYEILLLDVGLPDGTGIDLCQELRAAGKNVPIIFLSARIDEETVVKGITTGGDDYLRKPFGVEELKARMQKLLKRQEKREVLAAGGLEIDPKRRSAALLGQPINLGKREFDILTILVRKAGDVVTREAILALLDEKPEVYDRTIDSHISHLRRKMRDAGNQTLEIICVYGVGYRLQWRA